MNLREQLRNLLPEILPDDPELAIKGTELIRMVRLRLAGDYSDATLRYHFSILSYDSTSPIAKVDQGQGYYLRQMRPEPTAGGLGSFAFFSGPGGDAHVARLQRLLAIYERLGSLRGQHGFVLNGRDAPGIEVRGHWDIPDIIIAEWDMETGPGDVPRFDQPMLNLRRHLGGPEATITGVQLKSSVNLENYAAEFFQTLSATRWTLQSEMVIAEPVNDEALVEALRSLGNQFGVGISSLGIHTAQLDDLPPAIDLAAMNAAEFESVQSKLRVQRLTAPQLRARMDWQSLSALRKKHPAIEELVAWLSASLSAGRPGERVRSVESGE